MESRWEQVGSIPVFIQIPRAIGLNICAGEIAKGIWVRIVGGMGIHEMKPEKKRTFGEGCEPGLCLIHEHIGGGKSPQRVEICSGRNFHAVLEIEFGVEFAESENCRKTLGGVIEISAK